METQNNTKKQIIAWVIFAVVVVLVGGYFIFKSKTPSNVEQKSEGSITGGSSEVTEKGVVPAPGASVITPSGEVIAPSGKPAGNSALPGSENAPAKSQPISKEQIPAGAIKLEVTKDGFKPDSFTVKGGNPVVLSITSADDSTHVFRFDDPSLSGVAIGVGPNMTRVIPFNAPETPGEYTFRDDVPGNSGVGKMIVR